MYGEKLKALRLHYNYTQTYIEAKSGIKQNTYSQIERDLCETKDQTLEKIANLYNITLEDLKKRNINDLLPKTKSQDENPHSERMINLLSEELKQKNELINRLVSLIPPVEKFLNR